MKHLLVAGARPNFMKVAPILRELMERGEDAVLVHTGQHYDFDMSAAFFQDLGIPEPGHHLNVGSGSHAVQTAQVMQGFEPVLLETEPDWVVLVGDVNSTLACALVAVKLKEDLGCRIAHVEAGLRSGDWRMPEEINRVVTDRLSDLLLTTSPESASNLAAEGIPSHRIAFAGNVMIDTLLHELPRARKSSILERLRLSEPFVVVTLHRPSNVDSRDCLAEILRGLSGIARDAEVVLSLHPRTRERVDAFGLDELLKPLKASPPLTFREMLCLMDRASAVLTDSGGIQEETTVLGVPCVTLRDSTERPITITEGTNRLVDWPPTRNNIVRAWDAARRRTRVPVGEKAPEGWDGRASERIVDTLTQTGFAVASQTT